ncbi:hypothetical protein D9M68_847560 [compost metagenome]
MLQFLGFPLVGEPGGDFVVAAEEIDQVLGVKVGAAFDERGAGHEVEEIFVPADLRPRDTGEIQVLDLPVCRLLACHACSLIHVEMNGTKPRAFGSAR